MIYVLINLKCHIILNKCSRWKNLNILLFINVTEVADCVAPLFRIHNTCFLKKFQCEIKE